MKKVLRIIGFVIITIVAAIYLLIIIGGLFEKEPIANDIKSIGMLILMLLTVISVAITWVKVRIGVWIVLFVGIVFSIFGVVTAGQNRILAVIAAGGPLVLGSLLILLGSERKQSE